MGVNNISIENFKKNVDKYNIYNTCDLIEILKKDFENISAICFKKNGNLLIGNNNKEVENGI